MHQITKYGKPLDKDYRGHCRHHFTHYSRLLRSSVLNDFIWTCLYVGWWLTLLPQITPEQLQSHRASVPKLHTSKYILTRSAQKQQGHVATSWGHTSHTVANKKNHISWQMCYLKITTYQQSIYGQSAFCWWSVFIGLLDIELNKSAWTPWPFQHRRWSLVWAGIWIYPVYVVALVYQVSTVALVYLVSTVAPIYLVSTVALVYLVYTVALVYLVYTAALLYLVSVATLVYLVRLAIIVYSGCTLYIYGYTHSLTYK